MYMYIQEELRNGEILLVAPFPSLKINSHSITTRNSKLQNLLSMSLLSATLLCRVLLISLNQII